MHNNPLAKLHVLIVDDEKTIQRLVHDVLVNLGFRDITTANNGRQALDLMAHQTFDFIISDWCMPDMEGIDMLRTLRSSPHAPHFTTPVIMLTGNTEAKYVMRAVREGVNGYLIKPFSAAQLVSRIRKIIEDPKSFVIAPTYRGPDRRHIDKGAPGGVEKRRTPRK